MDNRDIIDCVNRLIETSKDGEFGFRKCAENSRDLNLRQLLNRRADECRQAASELRVVVGELGGEPEDGGSASAALHRGWVSVKGALTGYSDQALLEECERGEDVAVARYRAALKDDLPPSLRALVERQFAGVQRNHAEMRALRDNERAKKAA